MAKKRFYAFVLLNTGKIERYKVFPDSEKFKIVSKDFHGKKQEQSYFLREKKIRYIEVGYLNWKKWYPCSIYIENNPEPLSIDMSREFLTADEWNKILEDKVIRDLYETDNKNLMLLILLVLLIVSLLMNLFIIGTQQGWFDKLKGG